jgi:hypothetical protein
MKALHFARRAGLKSAAPAAVALFTIAMIFAFSFAASPAFGQDAGEEGTELDLDALFGDDLVAGEQEDAATTAPKTDPVASMLKSASVRIGGRVSASLSGNVTWNNLWAGTTTFDSPERYGLDPSLDSTLFFDARPEEDFRVYGSVKTSWPFAAKVKASTSTPATSPSSFNVPRLSVFELFTDISIGDRFFVRAGKSTVKWGVGYFWSPADVINLEAIDVFNAEAQREGPLNIRLHYPLPSSQNNFYLYTILDEDALGTDGLVGFEDTAVAAKLEFLVGSYELGIGGYYKYSTAERGMLTLTGPLGDVDLFGEAMLSRGSAKSFVESIAPLSGAITEVDGDTVRERFYASGSAGFMYSDGNRNLNLLGQYYYNGEGYASGDREDLVTAGTLALALNYADPAKVASIGQALAGLIYGSGLHYAAASISKGELFGNEDLSASVIAIANLSDLSGIIRPSLSWKLADNITMNLSPTFVFGPEDGEYAFMAQGDAISLSLGITASGAF